MITININGVQANLANIVNNLRCTFTKERYELAAATALLPEIRRRIHVDGVASDGSKIGTYTSSYLKYRSNNNRSKDSKVILSFTRQMENDISVVAGTSGWAIGYKNDINGKKVNWNEDHFGKVIFHLTKKEQEQVIAIAILELKKALKDCK